MEHVIDNLRVDRDVRVAEVLIVPELRQLRQCQHTGKHLRGGATFE